MVHAKTVAYNVLAVFLAVIMALCVPLRVRAGVQIGGINWNTNSVSCSKQSTFVDVPADGTPFGAASRKYVRPVEGVFYFSFYASNNIFKYDSLSLSYNFTLTPLPNVEFRNLTTECSLIHAGIEYPLPSLSGWINKVSLYATNTYMTVKVVYSGDLVYYTQFISDEIKSNTAKKSDRPVGFSLTLNTFDQYQTSDVLLVLDDKVDALAKNGAGLQGAIENQTGVIEKGNNLQKEQNQLQEKQNKLQEEQNQLQEEQNKQEKGFFDNFFSNLGKTVMSWIIPTSEQLTAFLDEVNNWFGKRLGFVWYPFDLAIDMVSSLAKGNASTKVKIPAFTLDMLGSKYTIWNAMEVDLDAFGIFQYVRFFTSVIIVGGVIRLASNKWDSWIGGRNG